MLHKRSIKEKLLKGSAWAFSGKVVTAFSVFFVNALLTRLLTPAEMGAYFLTLSLITVVAVIAQLGLTQTIIRLVAESMGNDQPTRARQSIVLVFRIIAVSGLVVASIFAYGGGAWIAERLFHSTIMSNVIGLVAIWLVLLIFQGMISEVYRGFHDIRLATIFGGLITSVISMSLFFILWWVQGYSNFHQIIILTLVASGSSVILSSLLLWKKISALPFLNNKKISVSSIMNNSWPLLIANLSILVLIQADLWIMGMFRSAEEVAVYGVATRTVILVSMPLLIVNAVVPPYIAEMYTKGKTKELESILRKITTLAGLPALFLFGVFIFYGDFILEYFFGSPYQDGAIVLAVLCVGQIVNVWSGSCGLLLIMTKHQVPAMWITLFSGFIAIFTSLLLVDEYGSIGVAIGTTTGMIVHNFSILKYSNEKLNIKPYGYFRFSSIINSIKSMG